MNLDLRKKHALVGGSSSGLGLASAIELALLGADITLMARNESRLRQAITQLDTSRGRNMNGLSPISTIMVSEDKPSKAY